MSENHPLCNARRNMLLQEPMTNGLLVAVNCARFCRSVLRNLISTDNELTKTSSVTFGECLNRLLAVPGKSRWQYTTTRHPH